MVEILPDRMTAAEFVLLGFFTLPILILTELAVRFFHRLGHIHLAERIRARVYFPDVSAPYQQSAAPDLYTSP